MESTSGKAARMQLTAVIFFLFHVYMLSLSLSAVFQCFESRQTRTEESAFSLKPLFFVCVYFVTPNSWALRASSYKRSISSFYCCCSSSRRYFVLLRWMPRNGDKRTVHYSVYVLVLKLFVAPVSLTTLRFQESMTGRTSRPPSFPTPASAHAISKISTYMCPLFRLPQRRRV